MQKKDCSKKAQLSHSWEQLRFDQYCGTRNILLLRKNSGFGRQIEMQTISYIRTGKFAFQLLFPPKQEICFWSYKKYRTLTSKGV